MTKAPAFARCLDRWSEAGALEIDVLEQSADRLSFNVTRCRYAEMYRALGLGDLGSSLSCQRDFSLIEGFNPAIELSRTQTITAAGAAAFGCSVGPASAFWNGFSLPYAAA